MRDIWRVFQGICSGSPKNVVNIKELLRIWYHENMRVFHDRLTTDEDRVYLKDMLTSYFPDYSFQK